MFNRDLLSRLMLPTLVLVLSTTPAVARSIYQQPAEFIAEVFHPDTPKAKILWLSGQLKEDIYTILGHTYPALRLRYWQQEDKTAWVLDEIGKEKPITLGIVIRENKIEQIKVLIFRESRGDEIRYPFFTKQFRKLSLDNAQQLNGNIDGISGATLSVRAVKKLARLALFLHQEVNR